MHFDVIASVFSGMVGELAINVGEDGSDSEWRGNNNGVVLNGEWGIVGVVII